MVLWRGLTTMLSAVCYTVALIILYAMFDPLAGGAQQSPWLGIGTIVSLVVLGFLLREGVRQT